MRFCKILSATSTPCTRKLGTMNLMKPPVVLLYVKVTFKNSLSAVGPKVTTPTECVCAVTRSRTLPCFLKHVRAGCHAPRVTVLLINFVGFILVVAGSVRCVTSVSLVSLTVYCVVNYLTCLKLGGGHPVVRQPCQTP